MEMVDIKQELADLNEQLTEKQQELEDYDDEEGYEQCLDDCNEGVFNIPPSTILKECDPIAYRCGLADYEDEGRSDLESEINELEEEIKDLEAKEELNEEEK